jgi:hypothetical protein
LQKEEIKQSAGRQALDCAFDASRLLWTLNFLSSQAVAFADAHPHGVVARVWTAWPSYHPASLAFAANGDYLIGHADGAGDVLRYGAANNLVQIYDVETGVRGSEFIELSRDQRTLFYTSQNRRVYRYDLETGTQLPDFAALPGAGIAFELKLLPPGNGSGGMLVADWDSIKLLNADGGLVRTYDQVSEDAWFGLALDPNGTSFWAGNITTGRVYRFNIATGALEGAPIQTPAGVAGLCVKGQFQPASSPSLASVSDASIAEGDAGSAAAEFTVSLDRFHGVPVSIGYRTAPSTATQDADYLPASGTVTFEPGETRKTVTVEVLGDQLREPDERFFVDLVDPTPGSALGIAKGRGTGTILDDERAGAFICRASALRVVGAAEPLLAESCADQELRNDSIAASAATTNATAQVTNIVSTSQQPDDLESSPPAAGDNGTARAEVARVTIRSGADKLVATGLVSTASATCHGGAAPPSRVASSSVASFTRNDKTLVAGSAHIHHPLGTATIHLNHPTVFGDRIVQRALWVEGLPLGADAIVAEVEGGASGNPCTN